MKYRFMLIALALAVASSWGQATTSLPAGLDGKIATGEYSYTKTDKGITVAARLSDDTKTLYVAVSAPTTGWVAIGLGSKKMSGAFMILGFVSDGKQTVSTEMGKGYTHSPVTASNVVSFITEDAGLTTLEISLPAAQSVKAGRVAAIAAFGLKDNIRTIHSKYLSLDIQL